MSTLEFLYRGWNWDWFGLAICAGAAAGCGYAAARKGLGPETLWLAGAIALLAVALVSPVRVLADRYLFSAHMLQHLLLLLVVPAMLWLGLLSSSSGRQARESGLGKAGGARQLGIGLSWLAGVGAMWFWHARPLCNAATTSELVFRIQVISLLAAGSIFWWPVFGSDPAKRLHPLTGVLYLFSACLGCTLLGIYITFSPVSVCPIYMHPADPLGILPLIRDQWGMNHSVDQNIGGLMMWVPTCLIYLVGIIGLLGRWYGAGTTMAECGAGAVRQGEIAGGAPSAKTDVRLHGHRKSEGLRPENDSEGC